ncbi:hypothetical protein [Candidatus Harpocratesius sp.]
MSSYQYRQRMMFRKRILDIFVLTLSVGGILGSMFMIGYCGFWLQIKLIKPYLLYFIIIMLGIMGLHIFRKEIEI